MLRVWGIIKKKNKIIKDIVVEDSRDVSESEAFHHCIEQICYEFDLQRPMWLPKNEREYEEYNRVVLNQDNFIETIDFDALELEIIRD